LLAACADVAAQREGGGEPDELVARRGDFTERVLLTGVLAAVRAEALVTPRTRTWQLKIRRLAEDGTLLAVGDPVVELDNSTFANELEEKRLAESEAVNSLLRAEAEAKATLAEKRYAVEQRKAELDKARIKAEVPLEVLTLREHQERQLALTKAQGELARAEGDLETSDKSKAADLAVQRIALEKARRSIDEARRAIAALTLRAPRAGVVLIGQHPWEGRKLRDGDTVWSGMPVAYVPDLSSMMVEAALSDVDDGRIEPGQAVTCSLDAYPALTWTGKITDVAPVANEAPRNPLLRYFPVRIALDRSDPERMRPGMSVRVEVKARQVRGAILAPRAALDFSGPAPRALLAAGGAAEVRLGPCSALECVVESGLEEGTRLRQALAPGGQER
jgi:multidrug resistance efflux pump